MKIVGYLPTSLIEWPGKIVAVVFVPGCNFRCPFCHNTDLVDPKKTKRLKEISEKSIFNDLEKRKKWVDGICLTGGEPTLQTDLSRFLSRVKQMGLVTMIETNGSRPEIIAKLLNGLPRSGIPLRGKMVDYIAMDIKGSFDRYAQISNFQFPISKIKKSIKLIIASGIDFEFRTTVVPTIHDKKNMVKLAKQLKEITMEQCNNVTMKQWKWILQPFQPKNCLDPKFNKIKPYLPKEMEEILQVVQKYIPGAELRGE